MYGYILSYQEHRSTQSVTALLSNGLTKYIHIMVVVKDVKSLIFREMNVAVLHLLFRFVSLYYTTV